MSFICILHVDLFSILNWSHFSLSYSYTHDTVSEWHCFTASLAAGGKTSRQTMRTCVRKSRYIEKHTQTLTWSDSLRGIHVSSLIFFSSHVLFSILVLMPMRSFFSILKNLYLILFAMTLFGILSLGGKKSERQGKNKRWLYKALKCN